MTEETKEVINKKLSRSKASMKKALKDHGVPKNMKLENSLFQVLEYMVEEAYFAGQMDGSKGEQEKPYWSSARF